MGNKSSKATSKVNKSVVVSGYCRNVKTKHKLTVPKPLENLICKYVHFQEQITAKLLVSENDVKKLSDLNMICIPRRSYNFVGQHKITIITEKEIKNDLKKYKKKPFKNKTIRLGELGMGMGFTNLVCYKMDDKLNDVYYYNEKKYFRVSVGGMNAWDAKDSYERYEKGEFGDLQFATLVDVITEIWTIKQKLLGNIESSDEEEV